MKKASSNLIFTILVIVSSHFTSSAQYFYYNDKYYDNDVLFEAGLSAGSMTSAADVGKKNFSLTGLGYDVRSTKFNAGFYAGVMYGNFGAHITYASGTVAGDDRHSNNSYYQQRNLKYRSSLQEISFLAEYHPLSFLQFELLQKFSPYLAGGVGYFTFNPQGEYKGNWVNLAPLRTEGQGFEEFPDRKPYNLHAVCFPMGGGIKYEISPIVHIRIEGLYRITTTDFLDDVSHNTYVDPSLFTKYFKAGNATIASAMATKYREFDINRNWTGAPRAGGTANDRYFTVNLKLGLTLGRQKIR